MAGNGTVWAVCGLTFAICLAIILAMGYTRWDWNSDMGITPTPTSTKAASTSRIPARTSRVVPRKTTAGQTTKAAQTTKAPATIAPATTAPKVCKPGVTSSQMLDVGNLTLNQWRAVGNCTGVGASETECCEGVCATAQQISGAAALKNVTIPDDVLGMLETYGPICTNV